MRTTASRSRAIWKPLVLALALGAITNILVTAWCVYAISTQMKWVYSGYWSDGTCDYAVSMHACTGKAMAYWHLPHGMWDYLLWKSSSDSASPFRSEIPSGRRPPRWTTTGDESILRLFAEHPPILGPAPDSVECSSRCDVAYGWPMLCFRGGMMDYPTPNGPSIIEHDFKPELPTIDTPIGPRGPNGVALMTMSEPRTMPLTPILPGVLANTASYSLAWWALLVVPHTLRRLRRRRRGACAACGYDRRGISAVAACPECGLNEHPAHAKDAQ